MANEERFEEVHREWRKVRDRWGNRDIDIILRDRVTGVLYYQVTNDRGTTMIPLLASNGKPIVDLVDD